jgi:hypothetical protein
MVFNATFNNVSIISWQSVLLVKETGVPGESYWQLKSPQAMYNKRTNHKYQSVIKTKYLKMYITVKMKDMFINSMSIKKITKMRNLTLPKKGALILVFMLWNVIIIKQIYIDFVEIGMYMSHRRIMSWYIRNVFVYEIVVVIIRSLYSVRWSTNMISERPYRCSLVFRHLFLITHSWTVCVRVLRNPGGRNVLCRSFTCCSYTRTTSCKCRCSLRIHILKKNKCLAGI